MILGITGCPGSGKTMLSRALAECGWKLLDADDMGREVVDTDIHIRHRLAEAFGEDILDSDGALNRRLTAQRAFRSPESLLVLNDIVHPPLIEMLSDRVRVHRAKHFNTVVDSALIFEWEIAEIFDLIVCVAAYDTTRMRRIIERDGRTENEVMDMFNRQLPQEEKISRSDIIFRNDKDEGRIITYAKMFDGLKT